MSGHSKWSKIKRKKGLLDTQRSKLFTKVIKEITASVRESGPDPDGNSRLRLAITNAKAINMPKDVIERSINKGSDKNSLSLTEVNYEGYGPGGIAIYVSCLTDNVNRTVSNVRSVFTKYDGNLSTKGSLEYLFDRKGVFNIPCGEFDEESFMLEVIDAGADDVIKEDNFLTIFTPFERFGAMQSKLEQLKAAVESAEVQMLPKSTTSPESPYAQRALKLIEALEEDDDVQNVFHNLEMSEVLDEELTNLE